MTTQIAAVATRDELLGAGLAMIDDGRAVFLLGLTKRPVANCDRCRDAAAADHDPEACECLTCHGFYAATADADRFREIRQAVPGGMLAVRTGAASGIVVVDGDPRHGAQIDPVLMPPTRSVITGSDGWHLWYRHPGVPIPNSQSRIGAGIDVRGDGGYAVVPPSVHPRTGRPYRWGQERVLEGMPRALVEACRPPAAEVFSAAATRSTSTTGTVDIAHPDKLLAALLTAVQQAPEGTRRTTLYGAARGVARMVAVGAISRGDAWAALTEAGRQAEQTERDIRRAIEGGFRDEGVTP